MKAELKKQQRLIEYGARSIMEAFAGRHAVAVRAFPLLQSSDEGSGHRWRVRKPEFQSWLCH